MKSMNLFVTFLLFFINFINLYPQPQDMYAVLVGEQNYQWPLPILMNTQYTASRIKASLVNYELWNTNNITILQDAKKADIQNAIQTMPRSYNSVRFFYYAGHGYSGPPYSGIMPINEPNQPENLAAKITPTELQNYFVGINNYAIYIDACYSGVFTRMTSGFIGTACDSTQLAWGGNASMTPFGGSLAYGMSSGAFPIGSVTAKSLFDYAAVRAHSIYSGATPQYKDNIYPSSLLLTIPAYNINLANSFSGLPNQGTISVSINNVPNTYTLPVSPSPRAYYGASVSVTATNQEINGIWYTFSHWQDGDVNFTKTINSVASDQNLTATYTGKPLTATNFLFLNESPGNYIQFQWTPNPNPHINYCEIWRIIKRGSNSTTTLIAGNVSPSTTSYTDYSCVYTSSYTDALISYDVRPHYLYSTDNASADPSFHAAFGTDRVASQIDKNNFSLKQVNDLPADYSIENYPNPFNPATIINYQLPVEGKVTLKVYDVLGKEVATLVDEYKPAGYYSVEFSGGNLSSGIYIYTINANNFSQTKKMMLVK